MISVVGGQLYEIFVHWGGSSQPAAPRVKIYLPSRCIYCSCVIIITISIIIIVIVVTIISATSLNAIHGSGRSAGMCVEFFFCNWISPIYNRDSFVFVLGIIQASCARNILTGEKCVACFSPKWSSFLSWPLSGLLHKMQLRHWQVFKSGEKCLISCLVLVPLSFATTAQGESSYVRLLSIWTSTAMWLR